MNRYEEFVHKELAAHLQADERIEHIGFLFVQSLRDVIRSDGLSLIGGGYYFAALTARRMALLAVEMGFFSLKLENKGASEIPYAEIRSLNFGGFLIQKSIAIELKNGKRFDFRLNTLATNYADGQKTFIAALTRLTRAALH